MADLTKDLADTVAIADSLVKGIGMSKTDNIGVADMLTKGTEKLFSDTIAINPWYNANWPWRIPITIDHTKVNSENQIDFPVLITEHDMPDHFWATVKADGSDIVVTSINGTTKLKRELVANSWDRANHKMELHVKVPILSNTIDTVLYLYYGNAAASETNDTDTWDSHFKAVYHMNDDPDTSHIKDSTANGNNGTKLAANEPNEVAGLIGKAQDFDGSDDKVDCGTDSSLDITGTITIEALVKPDTAQDGTQRVITEKAEVWGLLYDHPTASYRGFYFVDSDNEWHNALGMAVGEGAWHALAGVYDGQYARNYLDGAEANSKNIGSVTIKTNAYKFGIGADIHSARYQIDSLQCEVRISDTARSANWLKTTYNTLMSPATFYSVGSLGNADGIVMAFGKPIAESPMNIMDAISKELGVVKADNVAIADALSKDVGVDESDTMAIVDALSKFVGKPVSDTLVITDALSKAVGVIESETMALAETMFKTFGANKAETLAITDVLAKDISKDLVDAVTILDVMIPTGSYARPGIPIAAFLFQRAITLISRREV